MTYNFELMTCFSECHTTPVKAFQLHVLHPSIFLKNSANEDKFAHRDKASNINMEWVNLEGSAFESMQRCQCIFYFFLPWKAKTEV